MFYVCFFLTKGHVFVLKNSFNLYFLHLYLKMRNCNEAPQDLSKGVIIYTYVKASH